jgi:hypothetical protein
MSLKPPNIAYCGSASDSRFFGGHAVVAVFDDPVDLSLGAPFKDRRIREVDLRQFHILSFAFTVLVVAHRSRSSTTSRSRVDRVGCLRGLPEWWSRRRPLRRGGIEFPWLT